MAGAAVGLLLLETGRHLDLRWLNANRSLLASALAGRIAQGEGLASAVQTALNYTWRTLRDAEQLGQGQFVPRRLPLDFCS